VVFKLGQGRICLYASVRIIRVVAGICNCELELLTTWRSDTCPCTRITDFLNQIYRIIEKIITYFIKHKNFCIT